MTEEKLFEKFNKNINTLSVSGGATNTWFWRNGEIQYAKFNRMNKGDKLLHLKFLLGMSPEDRSTNDDYILKFYGPKDVKEQLHFFRLEENEQVSVMVGENLLVEEITSTEEDAPASVTEVVEKLSVNMGEVSVDELISYGKEYLLQYLNEYFTIQYDEWETDFKFQTLDKFVTNSNNFMHIDELALLHLQALKKIYFK